MVYKELEQCRAHFGSDGHRTHKNLEGPRVLKKMVSAHGIQWVKELEPYGTSLGPS